MTVNLPAFTSNPPQVHHQKTTFCTPLLPKPPAKRGLTAPEKHRKKWGPHPRPSGPLAMGGGGDRRGCGSGDADELGQGVVSKVSEPDIPRGIDGEPAGIADVGGLVSG